MSRGGDVDDLRMLAALEEALARLEVEVRAEPLPKEARVEGGLYVLRGRRVVVVRPGASVPDRVAVLADALARLPTETMFLPPAVRERIRRR